MKKYLLFLFAFGISCLLITSCSTSSDPTPSSGNGTSGGTGSGGGASGGGGNSNPTITYTNASFTPISITINNSTQTIGAGASVVYSGTSGALAAGTATTSGKTSSGTTVGNILSWTLSNNFPSSGNLTVPLNVGGNFFFLKMINVSGKVISKVYVNYQLTAQSLDNITIPSDGVTYSIGYYPAYTNSNVRAESGTTYWSWPSTSLALSFGQNQVTTIQAN